MIERTEADNPAFRAAAIRFLKHAQETINPSVTAADVREMLIQHILTEEIFSHVFDNADFHRQNNVARELYRLEETFFTGAVKHGHAGEAEVLLRGDPLGRRAGLQPPREAEFSQGRLREFLQGL